jgi:hypothetical protein
LIEVSNVCPAFQGSTADPAVEALLAPQAWENVEKVHPRAPQAFFNSLLMPQGPFVDKNMIPVWVEQGSKGFFHVSAT